MTVVVAAVGAAAAAPADAGAASGSRPPSLARTGNPPKAATAGDAIIVRWRAVNRSRSRSARVAVTVRLKPASGRSRLLAGRGKRRALRPRATYRGKARFTIPASVAPAEYTLVACLKRRRVKAVCRSAARPLQVAAPVADGSTPPLSGSPTPPTAGGTTAPEGSTTPPTDGAASPPPEPDGATSPPPEPVPPRLIAAGDIAGCESWSTGDDATAALLDSLDGDVVAPLGDLVYEDGTRAEFDNCYGPNWGRHKARSRPAVGNHEYYASATAAGYFGYFGAAAGDPSKGYYSYDIGSWHVVVLNTNCRQETPCHSTSPQAEWLRSDLAAHPRACTVAYGHHPLFNSSWTGPKSAIAPLWDILDEHEVDLYLAGHAHTYERFAPQTSAGWPSPTGVRQFIVGTGGRNFHTPFSPSATNSEGGQADTFGVLELTLHAGSYDWRFVPRAGGTYRDSGSARCV